jgi:hypothetical protein
MGDDPALGRLTRRFLLRACVLPALFPRAELAQTLRSQTMSLAEAAIERFRKGERYSPPPSNFLSSGKIVEDELEPFGPALRQESSTVREEIVHLLADLGKRADPLYPRGGQLIRDPKIISLLVDEALLKNDLGRQASLTALQEFVPASLLKPYGKTLAHELESYPDATALLLIAKVKPAEAASTVHALRETPRWSTELSAGIAAAALGDKALETAYVAHFVTAGGAEEKAKAAHTLGLIGTEPALRELAAALRTDLVIDKPELYFKRSVRVDILEALSYNFPEEVALYPSQVLDDNGYERAEQFCKMRLGVTWKQQRPPYLTIGGYPFPPRND